MHGEKPQGFDDSSLLVRLGHTLAGPAHRDEPAAGGGADSPPAEPGRKD